MSKKTITISEDVFQKLVTIKEDALEQWNEKQSFNDLIERLLMDSEYYAELDKHCLKCCDCKSCVEQRNIWREQETEEILERDWE